MSLSRSTSVYSGLDTVHLLGDLKTSRLFISKSDSLAYNAWKHLTGNSHLLNYCLGVELTKQLAVRVKTSFTFQNVYWELWYCEILLLNIHIWNSRVITLLTYFCTSLQMCTSLSNHISAAIDTIWTFENVLTLPLCLKNR